MTAMRNGNLCSFGGGAGSRNGGTRSLEALLNCGVPRGRHVGQCPEENARVGGWESRQFWTPERSDRIFHCRRMASVCGFGEGPCCLPSRRPVCPPIEKGSVSACFSPPFLQTLHPEFLFQLWALSNSSLFWKKARAGAVGDPSHRMEDLSLYQS